jgi:hypothetical protein
MDLPTIQIDPLHLGMQDVKAPALLEGTDRNNNVIGIGTPVGYSPQQWSKEQIIIPIHNENAHIRMRSKRCIEVQCGCQPTKACAENKYSQARVTIRFLSLTDMFSPSSVCATVLQLPGGKTGSQCHSST